jgi:hypothetical protein
MKRRLGHISNNISQLSNRLINVLFHAPTVEANVDVPRLFMIFGRNASLFYIIASLQR